MNRFIYRGKRRSILPRRYGDTRADNAKKRKSDHKECKQKVVLYSDTSLRIQKINTTKSPNPRPTQPGKKHLVSPNSENKLTYALFSLGYIFTLIRQLNTEDRCWSEYNEHTRSTAKLPTESTKSSQRMHLFRQTKIK